MATLRYAVPGVGGSLGSCAVCGESFLTEIILGKSVGGIKISGIEKSLPVHESCANTLLELQGPWEEIREKFPAGPMFDCFEEEFQQKQSNRERSDA